MSGETTAAESTPIPTLTPAPDENGRTEETPQTQAAAAAHLPKIGNFLGRHRLSAAIGRLQQEIQSLKSELEELDMMEPSSAACKEVLSSMEGKPDALLPITKGPENSAWERWFQPARSSGNRKWWNSKDPDFS